MSTYKTPGVYIEEIALFPPSVAPVETAIPAFIGYTEKAIKNGESLLNKPLKISSFIEFVSYFGDEPPRNTFLEINPENQFVKASMQERRYYLYDCVRMFYDNGGGDCYIISVGNYRDPIQLGDPANSSRNPGILVGLDVLAKYDEPTIITSPDAVGLGQQFIYDFQVQALRQCADLQDRVLICDLLKIDNEVANMTLSDRVDEFRNRIGINNLKYGGAYVPWLRASLPLILSFRDILFTRDAVTSTSTPNRESSNTILLGMTNSKDVKQLIFDLINANKVAEGLAARVDPNQTITGSPPSLIVSGKSVNIQLREALDNVTSTIINPIIPITNNRYYAQFATELKPIYDLAIKILSVVQQYDENLPKVPNPPVITTAASDITINFRLDVDIDNLFSEYLSNFQALVTHYREILRISPNGAGNLRLLIANDPILENAVQLSGAQSISAVLPHQHTLDQYHLIDLRSFALENLNTRVNADTSTDVAAFITALDTIVPNELQKAIEDVITAAKASAGTSATATQVRDAINDTDSSFAEAIARRYYDQIIDNGEAPTGPVAEGYGTLPPRAMKAVNDAISLRVEAAKSTAQTSTSLTEVKNNFTYKATSIKREHIELATNEALNIALNFYSFYTSVIGAANEYENKFDQSLKEAFGTYKTLLARAAQEIMVLPPSGAIAGVYAFVDANRGVWKAPANVSLNSVISPDIMINRNDQEGLNVDPNTGKSINAIRVFSGKGTLVWGARTLAGNDNEWRYINVRRFFNFVEESVKKATEPFVFEPNDANTWVKVKSMITNFLTLQWRDGALQGAKPAQAFFVKIGLGETMSAIDILEGRMIVEIGLAVVRPAEFIILKFSHKLPEA